MHTVYQLTIIKRRVTLLTVNACLPHVVRWKELYPIKPMQVALYLLNGQRKQLCLKLMPMKAMRDSMQSNMRHD